MVERAAVVELEADSRLQALSKELETREQQWKEEKELLEAEGV